MPRRPLAACALVVAMVVATVAACGSAPDATPGASATPAGSSGSAPTLPTARPLPGNEVFGYVPYWEMDEAISAHLRTTALTTLALFSVTNSRDGSIDATQNGYRRITGAVGRRMIREAHDRGVRVELVFSSFGSERNTAFLSDRELQDATIAALVGLAGELRVDGINADLESMDPTLLPEYGAFVGRLREAIVAADPGDRLSVATQANLTGAAMAAAAVGAGADRVFLMGYDYRVGGSEPGATAPLDRRDGDERDLVWSLELYAALGVPVERTLLGLPLYGMLWPVVDPLLGAPATGRGEAWIPRKNLDVLGDPSIVPLRDEIELVELYAFASDGSTPPPAPSAGSSAPVAPAGDREWRAVYVDSPATLAPKLALANERGLAGAGFWAIGYERGLPAYTDLIARFAAGRGME